MSYSSSLTDEEWEILQPLLLQILPIKKQTRPSNWTKRELLDGIFYQLKNGAHLARLAQGLAPLLDGLLALQAVAGWRSDRRTDESFTFSSAWTGEKKAKWTTLIIIDSQAVKNTCNASIISKGYCFYKSTNGIKRHLAVDTLGFPFFTHCTKANLSDDAGLIEMLAQNIDYFKSKPVNPREDHNLTRPRLPPWISDRGVRADLPTNYEEN